MVKELRVEVFVLNYNGESLLPECLPSIVEACKKAQVPCRLTVIDNESTDKSVEVLKQQFQEVNLRLSKNLVLCSFNEAVRDSAAEIVILLNNDLKVEPDFINPLIEVFKTHDDAFLAAPKAYTLDGQRYEGSLSKISFEKGMLKGESRFPGYEAKVDAPGFTMQAGFGAFRKEYFLKLGGFDPLYLPGTVEDSDLCFRAWKAGYACYYAPKSRVYHKGQATFKKSFGSSRLLVMNQRNLYLFAWKNISDTRLLLSHFLWFFVRPVIFLLQGRPEFFLGFLQAFLRLGPALKGRFSPGPRAVRTDREVFAVARVI